MTPNEQLLFNSILDKIVDILVKAIDSKPDFLTYTFKDRENDRLIDFVRLSRTADFSDCDLTKYFELVKNITPNQNMPQIQAFLPFHLPREIIEEIANKSETVNLLKLKGFNVFTIRIYGRYAKACGLIVSEKFT